MVSFLFELIIFYHFDQLCKLGMNVLFSYQGLSIDVTKLFWCKFGCRAVMGGGACFGLTLLTSLYVGTIFLGTV